MARGASMLAQCAPICARASSRLSGTMTRRHFNVNPSALQQASATTEPMTKIAVQQFEDGTHPALQKPVATRHTQKLKISECKAPHHGVIRLIGLNELKASNALGKVMVQELEQEVASIENEASDGPTRVVILASEHDRTFCAGANLKERAGMSIDETNTFLAQLRSVFARISNLPIPVIAAVHGNALGGGLELALCAHLRVLASTATVGLPEGRLAIVPGAGGTFRLPQAIGTSAALDLILTTRRLSGQEAYRIGLSHDCVTPDYERDTCGAEPSEVRSRIAVRQRALQMAAKIALCGPIATRAALQAVRGASQDAENAAYEKVIRSNDRNEALSAFREKRVPNFTGT